MRADPGAPGRFGAAWLAKVRRDGRWRMHAVLGAILGALLLATSLATAALWPDAEQVPIHGAADAAGSEIITVRVTDVVPIPCAQGGPGADGAGEPAAAAEPSSSDCFEVRATLPVGKPVSFTLNHMNTHPVTPQEGDRVRVITGGSSESGDAQYYFYDYPRSGKLLAIAVVFALIVIGVGRWRGALSLVGVAAAVGVLVAFVLPAVLAGKPPILVAVTASAGIMTLVLYLAHGISHRTTAALFGAIFGILFTAVAGFGVTRWLRFSGIASTEDASLLVAVPGLNMNDLLTATIVIAGLGVLNDITVAQASAVWEMRELNPQASKRRLYLAAMRIGRDHIASSIYTLVFAYAGAMLGVLLLIYTYPRDLLDLITSEQIAQEVVRTLIGAAGLVLSMPVTTALAVLFAREPQADDAPAAGGGDAAAVRVS